MKVFLQFFLISFELITGAASADQIFYPGTFDPFHQAHWSEVRLMSEKFPSDHIIVLPIHEAFYLNLAPDLRIPSLLTYNEKIEWIKRSVADLPRVEVSRLLKTIDDNPLDEISVAGQKFSGKTRILIGPDTLEKWKKLPQFEKFKRQFELLVTSDDRTPDLNRALRAEFLGDATIRFFDEEIPPIRSVSVNQTLMSGDGRNIENLLPTGAIAYVANNESDFNRVQKRFAGELETYVRANARTSLLPEFVKQGLPQPIADWISQDLSRLDLFARLGGADQRNLSHAALKLQRQLPVSLKSEFTNFFHANLFNISLKPEVRAKVQFLWVATNMLDSFRSFENRPGPLKTKTLKLLSQLQTLSWKVVWNVYKEYRGFAKRFWTDDVALLYRGDNLIVPPLSSDEWVTVYRGVAQRTGFDQMLKSWTETEGFISKTALQSRLAGADLEDAIAQSEAVFSQKPVAGQVVNQVVGDWVHDSSLISTSFDREIAERAAGIGGVVFTIHIPVSSGYFASDTGYWKNTHWEKSGNPNERLHEFTVKHRIRPDQIVSFEVVTSLPPTPVAGSFDATFRLVRSIPEIIARYCGRLIGRTQQPL